MPEIKLLVVDTERSPQEELRTALKKAGFEITLCTGVFDALDELSTQGAEAVFGPDLFARFERLSVVIVD